MASKQGGPVSDSHPDPSGSRPHALLLLTSVKLLSSLKRAPSINGASSLGETPQADE